MLFVSPYTNNEELRYFARLSIIIKPTSGLFLERVVDRVSWRIDSNMFPLGMPRERERNERPRGSIALITIPGQSALCISYSTFGMYTHIYIYIYTCDKNTTFHSSPTSRVSPAAPGKYIQFNLFI